LGDVIENEKNIHLLSNTTEKLSAIEHPTQNSFWVVTVTKNKTYHAFELTETGSINPSIVSGFSGSLRDGRGYLKISPNGDYIATANYSDETAYLYRFDSKTGTLDLERRIQVADNFFPYGVEFSQDSRFLYFTSYSTVEDKTYLLQYQTGDSDINNSEEIITIDDFFRGGLQLGIDGRIYRAKLDSDYLGVIANPEQPGLLCNYSSEGVVLGGGLSKEGLPSYIQSQVVADIQYEKNCLGEPTSFRVNHQKINSILWNFGDIASGNENTSEELSPFHIYSNTGSYTVTANVLFENGLRTQLTKEIELVIPPEANTPNNINLCYTDIANVEILLNEKTSAILNGLDPDVFLVSYHRTLADADTNSNALSFLFRPSEENETIYARLFNAETENCYDTTSFDIILEKVDDVAIADIIYRCQNGAVEVNAYQMAAVSYLWSTNETSSLVTLTELGDYSVDIFFTSGCKLTKKFEVVNQPAWEITSIETDAEKVEIFVSEDEGLELLFSLDGNIFQESNVFRDLSPGIYTVYVGDKNRCTVLTKQFSIFGLPKFFTPNNDGVNDIWDISSLSFAPNSQVYVFDRFGVLILQLNPSLTDGWDGTVNGRPISPSDYWYKIVMENSKDYFGHFSLKR